MKLFKLRSLIVAALLAVAISCNKDDEPSPFLINASVHPVDFLTQNTYTTLNIEVAYVAGYQPNATSLNNLVTFLNARLNKSVGITVTQHAIPKTDKTRIDVDEIRAIEKAQRITTTSGKTITAWIMFLDTEYTESTDTQKVLGLSYNASSIVIFEKSVYNYVKPDMPSVVTLESVVIEHEFCHLLGLVDNGTPMVTSHKDTDHGAHCSNTECLMYWKTESNINLTNVLGGDTYPTLDANCLADLKAAGGK
ncbi:MAG: membrane metalloprotease [Bacteroidota bacterium]